MFDFCEEKLLDCEERFAGRNGHRFVEVWDCEDGREPVYRSGELKEKEIAGWVGEERSANGPIQSGLRVLLSPKPSGKPSSGKLPFSRSTYLSLSQSWRIPSTFLRAITQKLSIVTQCSVAPRQHQHSTSATSPTSPPLLSKDSSAKKRKSKISDRARCLLVRGDVDWTWDYTSLLTYDPVTHTTYVLIVGLTATEIDLVQSYLSSRSLISSPIFSTHPLLIPIVLLDLATDDMSNLLKLRIKLLSHIQQQTGMDRFNSLKSAAVGGNGGGRRSIGGVGGRAGGREGREGLDLDGVMLRLTCLSDWVAAQREFVGIQGRVVNTVQEMLKEGTGGEHERQKWDGKRDGGDDESGRDKEVERMFSERLDFVQESLMAAEQKCVYLERSIGAQVQTIYSLIGQKDNRLNISAASASCQIASDSRRIAILTRRDSTDMRIIAAVTLLFLPGTFIATVFSTGLFDWGNGDPTPDGNDGEGSGGGQGKERVLSRYLWVYFMLTGILTVVVLSAWIAFSWVQNRRMMRQFQIDPEQEIEIEGGFVGTRVDSEKEGMLVGDRRMGSWKRRLSEFERWKDEARGSLRWWNWRREKGENSVERIRTKESGARELKDV
ncbi:hypothetical protein K469DRAFT_707841 [Zopfia rhizophila CBS 207.26]|uniref:Cora-domain-containing protein n=1 Tax=Zopfia rhizophila CBS 207.26 TaxID=1314779 RepID=A0A6A6E0Z5_9PEZI|nr:hypothetical protein K469DRAFT_707841 [Zopfia rhizophila CBS 207.26]